jgi:hypothetical protein
VAQGEPVREGQRLLSICDLKHMVVKTRIPEAVISRVQRGQKAEVRVDAFPTRVYASEVTQIATVASQRDFFAADVKVYSTVLSLAGEVEGLKPGMSAAVRIVVGQQRGVVQVPVQSVVLRVGWPVVCYVKTKDGIEEREVALGLRNDRVVEIKSGLKEGERVLRDPRAVALRLPLGPAKGDGAPGDRGGTERRKATEVLVRSVKPPEASAAPRARILAYGLTYQDLDRLGSVPGVSEVVPVRTFPHDVRYLERTSSGRIVATTPGLAAGKRAQIAVGRFLQEEDDKDMRNVAVLGADVAEALFPFEDPLGKTVRLGTHYYSVVGVLLPQTEQVAGLTREELNQGVIIPLPTCAARFGERIMIRERGAIRGEAVALNAIVVGTTGPDLAGPVAAAIRELLKAAHKQPDWEVVEPTGRR